MPLDNARLVAMYCALAGSRIAEEAITELARRGVLPGHHSGLGHESIGVGIGMALRPGDCAQISHRSGMMLKHARGGFSLRDAVLSKFGRTPDCHEQVDGGLRTLPSIGLVGSGLPMAVGLAMADRFRGRDHVTVSFFGDGAANEGAVHEAMNLAGARRLSMVFVAENNGIAISTPAAESTAAKELASRAVGYGMLGGRVDGQDPIAVYEAAARAIEDARKGNGPSLVEVKMLRWESHAEGFQELRSEAEVSKARSRDGLVVLRQHLQEYGVLTLLELSDIEADCRRQVDEAVREAMQAGLDLTEPAPYSDADARRLSFAP